MSIPARRRRCSRRFAWTALILARAAVTAAVSSAPVRPASAGAAFAPTPIVRSPCGASASARFRPRRPPSTSRQFAANLEEGGDGVDDDEEIPQRRTLVGEYVHMIRPVTLLQAVGALTVGRLALVAGLPPSAAAAAVDARSYLCAAASVYLSYGSGMVMNDCADAESDAEHEYKSDRPFASGRIGVGAGWAYAAALGCGSLASAAFGKLGTPYGIWTASNLILMLAYALGLQRALLVKNAVVGWLSVSPLIGAALLAMTGGTTAALVDAVASPKLRRLATVGFLVSVSREILKDAEDVETDRGLKGTLPLAIGEGPARTVAFGLAWGACGLLCTGSYRAMFASTPPWYAMGHVAGMAILARATTLPVKKGQMMLKRSIYVLLGGMIGGLLAQ